MMPIARFDQAAARRLKGVLFDLDDTLLSHGALTEEAFGTLFRLRTLGLRLVAVTGRPALWGELVVRQWPIDGAVTENGAVGLYREGRFVERTDFVSPDLRKERRSRLEGLVARVAERFAGLTLADDVAGRVTDMAWDIGERVKVPASRVDELASFVESFGAKTTRSSVHLHATYDGVDKASGVVRFLATRFGEDAGAALHRYAYLGDSLNDASCFAAFSSTFGVANVAAYVPRLVVPPRFVASKEMGAGFAEIGARIASLRETR